MTAPWYTPSAIPVFGAGLVSATMRSEFLAIQTALDKLPAFTGNASKVLAVNAGETAVEAISSLKSQTNGIIVGTGANVSPSSTAAGYLQFDGNGYDGYITLDATAMYIGHNSGSRNLVLQTDETGRMTVGADGRIVLGAGAVATAVDVAVRGSTSDDTMIALATYSFAGDLLSSVRNDGLMNFGSEANSPYNLTTASAANMHLTAANNVARSTSSIKYKKEVETATGSLEKVLALRPVKFRSKSKADGTRMFGGLIAEEVHDAGLGEYVEYNKDGEADGVMYSHLVALAFGAIQELNAKVDALGAK